MKNQNAKEAFVLVYNKDFSQINEMRLTDMDAFVYVTMKLMAGNPHAFARLYATPDAICSYVFTTPAHDMPQRFVNELRSSLKRISENGYIPYKLDTENKPIRHLYDIGVVWKKDRESKLDSNKEPCTLVPISAYKKIFTAFGLSETMKVRLFYFYIKLTSMIFYKTGVCTFSLDAISKKTNLSIQTVQDYIRVLETYKVITVYHMGKNIKQYTNYPANVLGQYYNREHVLQCGQDVYDAFCSQHKIKKDKLDNDPTKTNIQQASI